MESRRGVGDEFLLRLAVGKSCGSFAAVVVPQDVLVLSLVPLPNPIVAGELCMMKRLSRTEIRAVKPPISPWELI